MKFVKYCAVTALCLSGVSFADNVSNDMNTFGTGNNVRVSTGCHNGNYMVQLTNYDYDGQSCDVSCKHIISRDNFSAYLHPHQTVNLYGTHSTGHCSMTCTNTYHGSLSTVYFEARC